MCGKGQQVMEDTGVFTSMNMSLHSLDQVTVLSIQNTEFQNKKKEKE